MKFREKKVFEGFDDDRTVFACDVVGQGEEHVVEVGGCQFTAFELFAEVGLDQLGETGEGQRFDGSTYVLVLETLCVLSEDVVVDLLDGSLEKIYWPSDCSTIFS